MSVFVETLADLKAVNTATTKEAYLKASGRAGQFIWNGADLSAVLVAKSVTSTTVTPSTDMIVATNHGFRTGNVVVSQSAVNGLAVNTKYWVIKVDDNSFKLAVSFNNAFAGTAVNLTGSTNFTIDLLLDPGEGFYVVLTGGALNGSAGAWKRAEPVFVDFKHTGAVGDGSTDDSEAIYAAFNLARFTGLPLEPTPPQASFAQSNPSAAYAHLRTLDFTHQGIRIRARGSVVLKHIGSGRAVVFDAGEINLYDMEFKGFKIVGNSQTTDGLFTRHVHHSKFEASIRNVSVTGLRTNGGVLNDYRITLSNQNIAFSTVPQVDIIVDESSPGNYTADCNFHLIAENAALLGVDVVSAQGCSFWGTSEGITLQGIRTQAKSRNCTFYSFWMEANGGYDATIDGYNHHFINCKSMSPAMTNTIEVVTAVGTKFTNCELRCVNLQSTSKNTIFIGGSVSDHPALGIRGSSDYWALGVAKVNNSGDVTSYFPNKLT